MIRVIFVFLFAAAACCRGDELSSASLFAEAGRAYDSGQFADAAARYEDILKSGYEAPELFFNLGNAYFKKGDAGRAILNYRRTWTRVPRDADLAANLRFALQQSGAQSPGESALTHVLSRLAQREWAVLGLAAYWLAAGSCIVYLLARRRHGLWLRLSAASAIVLIVSIAGWLRWYSFQRSPEWVVLEAGQQALFAPLDNSKPHFALPAGSIVRQTEESGLWLKVKSGKDIGWLRKTAAQPVSTWQVAPHT